MSAIKQGSHAFLAVLLVLGSWAAVYASPPVSVRFPEAEKVKIFTQNMGLLGAPAKYAGAFSHRVALTALISHLREMRPSIVALQEMQVNSERARVIRELRDIYPWHLEGPDKANLAQDGGLLLLSAYPILTDNSLVYRNCTGEDCLANKGALRAYVMIDDDFSLDVYATHLQNDSPIFGSDASARASNRAQISSLGAFIEGTRSRMYPALVFGDFNLNGLDPDAYHDMVQRLAWPSDLWRTSGDGTSGVTCSDPAASFTLASLLRPAESKDRRRDGTRVDYFLGWMGTQYRAIYENTEVKMLQITPGRDLSDHYGLMTTLVGYESVQRP